VNTGAWARLIRGALKQFGLLAIINLAGFLTLFMVIKLNILADLLFEQMLLAAMLTGILTLGFVPVLSRFKIALVSRSLITGLLLFILIAQGTLLNIDRSRSLYILSWAHNNSIKLAQGSLSLESVVSSERLIPTAVLQRIKEHKKRGLMKNEENYVVLTRRGELYFQIANHLARIFNLTGWKENKN
jgi:hypothetical protein